MISAFKKNIVLNVKNLAGWRTKRKIVVISADDYGNVRLHSNEARERMDRNNLKVHNHFDALDTLETREDLEALYETLSAVKDQNGRHAVITAFALPCNIDFERVAETGYRQYYYELLPATYQKLAGSDPPAYERTWDLWREGLKNRLIVPQFHGREHLNLKVFEEKLSSKDHELLTALKNRSFTSISDSGYDSISPMAAFDFWSFQETDRFDEIIVSGLDAFKKVFGYRATHFNPPGGREHPVIHKVLKENGIKFIDSPLLKREHQGNGMYKKVFNYTGKTNSLGQIYLVRNVVFEPIHDRNIDWISYTMKQIETAFRWNRPAIISSHRVNFCGHIDENNRKKGLGALKELLKAVTRRWPEVEFLSANELGELVASNEER